MLRLLTVDDFDAFQRIRAEALLEHPESFGSPEEQQGGEVQEATYRRWLSGSIFGAFENEVLIGVTGFYVSADKRSKHRGNIFTVFVRKQYRGKGIGDELIKAVLALAETRVDQVHLSVALTARAAIRIYQQNGFEILGTDPRVFRIGDTAYDEYLMIKKFR